MKTPPSAKLTPELSWVSALRGDSVAASLMRYAHVTALLRHFSNRKVEVLARVGITVADLRGAETTWTTMLAKAAAEHDKSPLIEFGRLFVQARGQLKECETPIEAIGALPEPVVTSDVPPSPAGVRRPPGLVHPSEASAAELPSYLLAAADRRVASAGAIASPAEPPRPAPSLEVPFLSGAMTFAEQEGPSIAATAEIRRHVPPAELPFSGTTSQAQIAAMSASVPAKTGDDLGETAMFMSPEAEVSSPRQGAALVAPVHEVETTIEARSPGLEAPLPFTGSTSREALAALRAAHAVAPKTEEDFGETEMFMSPYAEESARRKAEAVGVGSHESTPPMALERYAELRARLNIHGENDRATLVAFSLTETTKVEVQRRFAQRFSAEPGLLEAFTALVRDEVKRLSREGGT